MLPKTRYANLRGSLVAYQVVGDAPIDLVFSVGITNIEAIWDHPLSARFLERIASFSRLILFDFRGSGISDPLSSTDFPTWEEWAEDVLAVLDEVGSERAALVAGGTAGPSAMIFAATYPQRTSALVLYQTAAKFIAAPDFPWGYPPETAAAFAGVIESLWGTEKFAAMVAPSMTANDRFLSWVARTQRLSATPRMAAAMIAYQSELDARDLLPLIRVPTLVLHNRGSKMGMPIGAARFLADRIEGARLLELAGPDDLLFGTQGGEEFVDQVEEFLTGVRRPTDTDRVLATVLFTDIVGSTERAAELGDREWRRLLDEHDALVRDQVDAFRGRLIKTTGDGALATFDGPARAIRCARTMRSSVRTLGIEIRAGLHAGEVELRGDDVGGIAVHLGARVAAKAAASEILVSSTVKDLVAGSGLDFEERGSHSLKGVPGDWQLFAVTS
jgi:class 3 adenylate cyclase